jgi:hypothetical protein
MKTEQEETLTIEGLQALFDKNKAEAKTLTEALLSDWENKIKTTYTVDKGPEKVAVVATKEQVAEMADAGIAKMEIMDLPLGQVLIGGSVAVLASELVDGFLASQKAYVRGGAKLVVAWVANKYLKKVKFIGADGAKAVALLLTFDAVRDIIPIDSWMQSIAGKISGAVTNKGLAQTRGPLKIMSNNSAPAASYGDIYTRAQGRG